MKHFVPKFSKLLQLQSLLISFEVLLCIYVGNPCSIICVRSSRPQRYFINKTPYIQQKEDGIKLVAKSSFSVIYYQKTRAIVIHHLNICPICKTHQDDNILLVMNYSNKKSSERIIDLTTVKKKVMNKEERSCACHIPSAQ